MLIFWSFDAKIVIAIKIQLIAQPYCEPHDSRSYLRQVLEAAPHQWVGVPLVRHLHRVF